MKTKQRFKNYDTFLKYIRKCNRENWLDWYKISGHWFTIEEYDYDGKIMRLISKTANKEIVITTNNRYSDSWLSDAEIEVYEPIYYRFDDSYYQY